MSGLCPIHVPNRQDPSPSEADIIITFFPPKSPQAACAHGAQEPWHFLGLRVAGFLWRKQPQGPLLHQTWTSKKDPQGDNVNPSLTLPDHNLCMSKTDYVLLTPENLLLMGILGENFELPLQQRLAVNKTSPQPLLEP